MCTGPINPPMTLLNVISYTSYFIRFLKTPEGYDITTLQAHRTAQEAEYMSMLNATEVGEAGQFLSTLLLLQGAAAVADEDRNILIPKLRQWQRSFNGLASDVSERCLAILTDDPNMRSMMSSVKSMIERKLVQCNGPGCSLRLRSTGADLLQCARCKSVVYCGPEHQRVDWPTHKAVCFPTTY
ncbi:hypothetical protein HGRIS_001939 [Hohenbuehelia grisea]|uniref:MYND-type domain-containing protein n=1 Tax=Hohenbuehelia grisea TaxID=104357 RepID=A0ABR3JKQ9_9AGAR